MSEERFDVIVVGAGPAGLAAAYTMAQAGLEVIVIERGDYPGAKNVMGGVVYRRPTEDVFPDFWQGKSSPVERNIVKQSLWLMNKDAAFSIGYGSAQFKAEEGYNAFTVLRAKFDQWMAAQVEEAGAIIINETTVTDLIMEHGKVVGVRTSRDDGDLYADLVIVAQGVNNLLVQQVGLGVDLKASQAAVAVKEIIALPTGVIEDRFNLEKGEGATIELVGESTMGLTGTAFIYTNKDSLSIGAGALVSQVQQKGVNPNDILENLKEHPMVKPLIAGGETKEYMAHLIPEGGYHAMPKVYADGVMVVGDAAQMVNGMHREGSNLAITSGKLAGLTAIEAKERGDYSSKTLSRYQQRLEESFVLKDLKKYRNLSHFIDDNTHLFTEYPEMVLAASHELMTVDGTPKGDKFKAMFDMVKSKRSLWQITTDLYKGWRAVK